MHSLGTYTVYLKNNDPGRFLFQIGRVYTFIHTIECLERQKF